MNDDDMKIYVPGQGTAAHEETDCEEVKIYSVSRQESLSSSEAQSEHLP